MLPAVQRPSQVVQESRVRMIHNVGEGLGTLRLVGQANEPGQQRGDRAGNGLMGLVLTDSQGIGNGPDDPGAELRCDELDDVHSLLCSSRGDRIDATAVEP